MRSIVKYLASITCFMVFMVSLNFAHSAHQDKNGRLNTDDIIVMELKDGIVEIELFPEKAPNHVNRIKELTREGFYNQVPFHRVIGGFMAQTGDPTGTGTGGSSKPNLEPEFNDIKHDRGIVSMARAYQPNSANSQFFIVLAPSHHLDGQYTAFGKVIGGMEHVDKIKKGDNNVNGMVVSPDKIISMKVLSDMEKKK